MKSYIIRLPTARMARLSAEHWRDNRPFLKYIAARCGMPAITAWTNNPAALTLFQSSREADDALDSIELVRGFSYHSITIEE